MLFITSLHEVYHDIYALVKLGFSAEYVEGLSPAERGIFKNYHAMELQKTATAKNAQAAKSVGLDLEDIL